MALPADKLDGMLAAGDLPYTCDVAWAPVIPPTVFRVFGLMELILFVFDFYLLID